MNLTTISCYRSFRVPVNEAWLHLSRPELLARWLGRVEMELVPDGEVSLTTWNGDVARGRVISVVPPVRLELRWHPFSIAPESHVVIRLEGDGPGSRLTVTHDGLSSEPERRVARQTWKEALTALRSSLHDGRDAQEWGVEIPVAVRAPVPRSALDLWPLISTRAGIEKWVAHVDRFDGEPGGMFRFTSRFQGREIIEEGRIEEMVRESRVALSWEWIGEGWGAPTRVEFSVEPEPEGASVLVVHSGFELVSAAGRLAARRNYAAAWPEVLSDLKRLVAPVAA